MYLMRWPIATKKVVKPRVNLDEVTKEDDPEKSGEEQRSNAGSEEAQSDYDVDEEYDNDYAENYFDNGEGDDLDNLGDGGMGDDGGGAGKAIHCSMIQTLLTLVGYDYE
jgi:DNA-directed RNA polymerase III subunit RPC7